MYYTLTINSLVPTAEDYLRYETESNELLADYLADGDLDVFINEEESIRDISNLCPYEHGTGVYINRAWLRAIDLELKFDDKDACGTIEPRSPKESNHKFHMPAQYVIYPNPAREKDEIIIRFNNIISRVYVTDILGRIITQLETLNKDTMQFNFRLGKKGLYVISVWDMEQNNQSFKVVIVD
jgi:hypothetical protein